MKPQPLIKLTLWERLIDKIDDFLYLSRLGFISRFIGKIYRALIYAKMSWTIDKFDWDYSYMIDYLAWKIHRMHLCLEKNGVICDKRCLRQMKVTEVLLRRHLRGKYFEDEWDKHIQKWGERGPGKNGSSKQKKQYREEFINLMNKGDVARRKDLIVACRIIGKYSEGWWD